MGSNRRKMGTKPSGTPKNNVTTGGIKAGPTLADDDGGDDTTDIDDEATVDGDALTCRGLLAGNTLSSSIYSAGVGKTSQTRGLSA